MRDSLVASSTWRPRFKKALETYPEFEAVLLEFTEPGCDACHISSRLSTLIGRVHGEPYDRLTFEVILYTDALSSFSIASHTQTLAEDTDDDSEDEEELQKQFNLGRFCARRIRVFHRLTHWEVRAPGFFWLWDLTLAVDEAFSIQGPGAGGG